MFGQNSVELNGVNQRIGTDLDVFLKNFKSNYEKMQWNSKKEMTNFILNPEMSE